MLETNRLMLKVVQVEDVDDIFMYASNPHTMRFERSEFTDKSELKKLLQWFSDNKAAFSVREKNSDRVIGQITLTPTRPTFNNEYNLGYIFHQDYQGRGYCTEACMAVLDDGFLTKKVHRIRAACNPDNIASWKVMEKLGFRREAHFINRVCFRNDSNGDPIYTDEYVYAINIEEYISRKKKTK